MGTPLYEMLNLRDFVEQYLVLSGGFRNPVALTEFPCTDESLTAALASFDEDYQISRYLHFSNQEGKRYAIGAEEATHLTIDEAIREIL